MWMEHVSQLDLLKLSLYGAIVGAVLAVIYDCFRIIRMIFPFNLIFNTESSPICHCTDCVDGEKVPENVKWKFLLSYALIFVQDILFCIISAAVISVTVFNINSGQPRWFIFLGVIFGFVAYRLTLSRPIMKLATVFIRLVGKLIGVILSVTVIPMIAGCKRFFGYIRRKMRRKLMIRHSRTLIEGSLHQAENVFGFDCSNLLN